MVRRADGGLTADQILQVSRQLGIGLHELAHLLGVTPRTVQRGLRLGSRADLVLQEIRRRLDEPRSAQSIRALAVISAQSGGLEVFLSRLAGAYVTLDLLRV